MTITFQKLTKTEIDKYKLRVKIHGIKYSCKTCLFMRNSPTRNFRYTRFCKAHQTSEIDQFLMKDIGICEFYASKYESLFEIIKNA